MNIQQRQNLARLALYVRDLPSDYQGFSMKYFVSNGGNDTLTEAARKPENIGCGTCACFAGHGPMCGILPEGRETWADYIVRSFGSELDDDGAARGNYDWLFHEGWSNSTADAAKRAAWLLEGGEMPEEPTELDEGFEMYVPDGFDSYTPDWKTVEALAASETQATA